MVSKERTPSRAIRTARFLLGGDGPAYRQVWDAVKKQVVTVHRDELDGRDPCCGLYSYELPNRQHASAAAEVDDSQPTLSSNALHHSAEMQHNNSAPSEELDSPTASADNALKLLRRLTTNPELDPALTSAHQLASPRRRGAPETSVPAAAAVAATTAANAATMGISPFSSPAAVEFPGAADYSSSFTAASSGSLDSAGISNSPKGSDWLGPQRSSNHPKAVKFAADVVPAAAQLDSRQASHHPIERSKSTGLTLDSTPGKKAGGLSPVQVPRSKSTGQLFKSNRLPPLGVYDSSVPGARQSRHNKGASVDWSSDLANFKTVPVGSDEDDEFFAIYQAGTSTSPKTTVKSKDLGKKWDGSSELTSPIVASRSKELSVRWDEVKQGAISDASGSSNGSSSRSSLIVQRTGSSLTGIPGTLLASAVAAVNRWKQTEPAAAAAGLRSRRVSGHSSSGGGRQGRVAQQESSAPYNVQRQRSSPLNGAAVHLPPLRYKGDMNDVSTLEASHASGQPTSRPGAAAASRLERSKSGTCTSSSTVNKETRKAQDSQYKPHHLAIDKFDLKAMSRAKSERDSTRYDRVISGLL